MPLVVALTIVAADAIPRLAVVQMLPVAVPMLHAAVQMLRVVAPMQVADFQVIAIAVEQRSVVAAQLLGNVAYYSESKMHSAAAMDAVPSVIGASGKAAHHAVATIAILALLTLKIFAAQTTTHTVSSTALGRLLKKI